MAPTTPRNIFLGVAHPMSRPWKCCFQWRLLPWPAPGNWFSGAAHSMARPWNAFSANPKFEFLDLFPAVLNHSNFCFPPIYSNLLPVVFNYSNFCFPPIFTCKAIAQFDSAFQNTISTLFKFLFRYWGFCDRWWIYFLNITNYKFNIKSYKSIITVHH